MFLPVSNLLRKFNENKLRKPFVLHSEISKKKCSGLRIVRIDCSLTIWVEVMSLFVEQNYDGLNDPIRNLFSDKACSKNKNRGPRTWARSDTPLNGCPLQNVEAIVENVTEIFCPASGQLCT